VHSRPCGFRCASSLPLNLVSLCADSTSGPSVVAACLSSFSAICSTLASFSSLLTSRRRTNSIPLDFLHVFQAVTIGLGGLYSGAPWHGHGAAFVEVLHGAKHFSFLPPSDPAKKAVDVSVRGLSQLHWHREKREKLAREGYLTGLIECTVFPGELLFFPPNWFHGVTNAGQHTAFVSTFLS